MGEEGTSSMSFKQRLSLLLLFLICESLVFFLGVTYTASLSKVMANAVQIMLAAIFLTSAALLQRNEKGRKYWRGSYALFVASVAILLRTNLGDIILELSSLSITTPPGIAVAKFSGSIWQVLAIVVLITIGGDDLRSIYLNKGRLELGLAVGLIAFVTFAVIAYLPVINLGISSEKILSWSPWVLLFVLTNGFTEELLYRGLFLRRLEPFFGKNMSNLLLAVVFTLTHMRVTYTADIIQFLVIVFPLALVWGLLMQKTDSLWGSALFHAGADLLVIVGYFAVL